MFHDASTCTQDTILSLSTNRAKLGDAIAEKDAAVEEKDKAVSIAVKDAVKAAKAEERQHFSKVVEKEKKQNLTLKGVLDKQKLLVTNLLNRSVFAERDAQRAHREAQQSARRSKDVQKVVESYESELKELKQENSTYRNAIAEMDLLVEESARKLEKLELSVPIKEIKKIRTGRGGSSSWPLYIWDLILEQLVNGTPPSSVSANIHAHVKKFSPSTKITELPSIWTIRRVRSVLLIVCQTLAAYRLAKAGKWAQIFTDATSRRQVTFQNLLISVEEDELFR